jgi:hypothetical protein
MTVLVEYLVRLRLEEPSAAPSSGASGEALALLLAELEAVALETEIVSRVVLAGPDQPSRICCAARSLDPHLHYATTRRYTLTTPSDETITTCGAACLLSWICHKGLPADTEQPAPAEGEVAA